MDRTSYLIGIWLLTILGVAVPAEFTASIIAAQVVLLAAYFRAVFIERRSK